MTTASSVVSSPHGLSSFFWPTTTTNLRFPFLWPWYHLIGLEEGKEEEGNRSRWREDLFLLIVFRVAVVIITPSNYKTSRNSREKTRSSSSFFGGKRLPQTWTCFIKEKVISWWRWLKRVSEYLLSFGCGFFASYPSWHSSRFSLLLFFFPFPSAFCFQRRGNNIALWWGMDFTNRSLMTKTELKMCKDTWRISLPLFAISTTAAEGKRKKKYPPSESQWILLPQLQGSEYAKRARGKSLFLGTPIFYYFF